MRLTKLAVPVLAATLALTLGACDSGSSSASGSGDATSAAASTQAATAQAADAAQADYTVTIDGCQKATDYNGAQAVIVTYTYTNNSDKATSFDASVYPQVYQDGVQQAPAIVDGIDSSTSYNNVQPGTTVQVQLAYEAPSGSDVQVQVYDILGQTKLAEQSFSLA